MHIAFPKLNPQEVVEKISEAMGGRSLGDMVKFSASPNQMLVTISKLGTSTLTFDRKETPQGVEYLLTTEKIAFSHRVFKDEVKEKLMRVIEKAGGTVLKA